MISIEVQGLTKEYRKGKGKDLILANDNLTFTINRGEIFGLLGPNGAGKTTLIQQVIGLLKPNAGSITVEGIDVVKYPDMVKPLIGFLPQTGLPMRSLEVERALHYTGRLRGQSEGDAKLQTRQLIEELDLGKDAKRYVNKLSGGMLRLVNFAMSLMGRPKLLVLDEPTNELDPVRRKQVWDKIAELNRLEGVTCILVTHNVLEAEKVIQRVCVMQSGRIVVLGTPGEIKKSTGSQVRLEFQVKEGEVLPTASLNRLADLGQLEETKPGKYRLVVAEQSIPKATEVMVQQLGLDNLEDFRIAPPSLEDVYLEVHNQELQ